MIFGTLKKKPSRAGALASIASAAGGIGDLVLAHRRAGFADLGRRLDRLGVEFVELVDIAQHFAHLDLEALLLGRRKLKPREARDVADLLQTDLFLAIAG